MAQTFKNGTVVKLKSGGPNMTVVNFDDYGGGAGLAYLCKWFDGKGVLQENTFSEAELEPISESPKPTNFVLERG